jgi:hypothetical protein
LDFFSNLQVNSFFSNEVKMDYAQRAYDHILHLSVEIKGRGSCTANEHQAAKYVLDQLQLLGVPQVESEKFRGVPSTYWPYCAAFGAALVGTLLALLMGSRIGLVIGGIFNLLGLWAMFAESEFATNWTRWISPAKQTENVIGVIPPEGAAEHKVVLCAHLDSHRTPVFFSTRTWQHLFSGITTAAFLSLAAAALVFLLGAIFHWDWLRWAGIVFAIVQGFVLVLVASADFTPFSPGANDNASGVSVVLGLAEQILKEPLSNTEVNLLFTDCEETGAHGMIDYLDKHSEALGKEAVYIILDEVGAGQVKIITTDGLVFKHATHPSAMKLARLAASKSGLVTSEGVGAAYTDALPATKRGLVALALISQLPPHSAGASHWHQVSDRIEFIELQALQDIHEFTWTILQAIEHQEGGSAG